MFEIHKALFMYRLLPETKKKLTPDEEYECDVSSQPVMPALFRSLATSTYMLPWSKSVTKEGEQKLIQATKCLPQDAFALLCHRSHLAPPGLQLCGQPLVCRLPRAAVCLGN